MPFLLKQYYNRFFPYDKYYQWLSYETPPEEYFSKREFSFTLKDDVYIRYQSFESRAEMEKGRICVGRISVCRSFISAHQQRSRTCAHTRST